VTDYLEFDLLEYHTCKKTKRVYYFRGGSVHRAPTGAKKFHAPKNSPRAVNTKGRRKS